MISVKKTTPKEAANRYAVYLTVTHQQSPEAEMWMLPPATGDSEPSLSYFFRAKFQGVLRGYTKRITKRTQFVVGVFQISNNFYRENLLSQL